MTHRPQQPGRTLPHAWTAVAGASIVAGAYWLRSPGLRYLVICAAAMVAALFLAFRLPRRTRTASVLVVAVGLLFSAGAAVWQRDLSRIERDWPAYRQGLIRSAESHLHRELSRALASLERRARQALDVPVQSAEREGDAASGALEHLVAGGAEGGVVVYDRNVPRAWAGRVHTRTDTLSAGVGATYSAYYVSLHAVARSAQRRAVVTLLVHAEPPADQLADALDEPVTRRTGVLTFEYLTPERSDEPGVLHLRSQQGRGDTVLRVRAVPPGPEQARLDAMARSRLSGSLLLLVTLILFVAAAWRLELALGWRLAPLGVALACIALVPLNAFSNATVLFDPTVYFAELGAAYTASVGALTLASALVLLALLLILRWRFPLARWAAGVVVVAITVGGPFLLRALARGVSPPPGGVTTGLWLAWEVALFFAAASLLVAATAAGGRLLQTRRGLPPWVAPALAAIAATLGPMIVTAPGRWPRWYVVLWIVVIGALALTRRHRAGVLIAASVAALGATTLTWNAGLRGRIALAERDVSSLQSVEPEVVAALERLGVSLARDLPPRGEADLLRAYVRSDLAGAGYPVQLARWSPQGEQTAGVPLAQMPRPEEDLRHAVNEALRAGTSVLHQVSGVPGTFLVLAVPHGHPEGLEGATSVLVAPRTRLIPDAPFISLMGVTPRERGMPPYAVSLVSDVDPARAEAGDVTRWMREGSELHGNRVVTTADGPVRAHIEIDLRSIDTLVQRGTLVVFLDLLFILALWAVSVLPGGGFQRWTSGWLRRWRHSYRARLTIALFAFFVLPALAFAAWSYQRLQSEDRQSRELLLRETLRDVAVGEASSARAAGHHEETPLFVYRSGELWRASEPILDALAPIGRFLPARLYAELEREGEVFGSHVLPVAGTDALFGYRAVGRTGGDPLILGAPAPGNDEALDQRRRDLVVLLLFSTLVGALAALWLSGIAARSLAEPIGRLRSAALAIAGGEREPPLDRRPPAEFEPVFAAFRRMASDLGESRAALESAQRRTAAVLRNVASGVVAVNRDRSVALANPRAESLLGRALPPGLPLATIDSAVLQSQVSSFLDSTEEERELELSLGGRQFQARLTRLTSGAGGAVLTLDDVTDLARAQRVLAWGEMARQVAHEIKNPLTPIRLGVQHVRRAHSDARPDFDTILDQNVRRILAEIDRLDEIARAFSRYGTAPANRLPAQRTDVTAVVRDAVELERLGESEIVWRLHGASEPLFAEARTDELREVLLNVLENARLANARHVEVRLAASDERVTIEVIDDGSGIPAHVLPRIFEPHFSTRSSGSGLGLALSRQAVEGWGGAIAIASGEGTGTTVRVELPRAGARADRDGA
ncbi:MAG TPA: ATP-binding protein [Gemmatimonadaceae bacterium]|nr:ATP-binding protein [Gemmatimonadaceae bacterium]